MKVLITGGAGFIGFHLAKILINNGFKVYLTDIIDPNNFDKELKVLISQNNCEYIECNLLNFNQIKKIKNNYDIIFHLAAIVGVENVISDSYGVLTKNQIMLSNIIDISKEQTKKPRLIFTSTSEVYAGSQFNKSITYPTPEDSLLILPDLSKPRTSYMLSKLYGEAMCQASGLDFLILRPHNIFGPRMGMKHVIPQLIKKILFTPKNGTLDIYSPNHTRTFCYVNYAVEKIYNLISSSNFEDKVLNLGISEPEIKIKELSKILLKVAKRNDIFINELENTEGSPSRRVPDTTKLINSSDHINIPSLIEGITKTFDWYKNFLD